MNWKNIWIWIKRIVFLLLVVYSFDNGFGLWFILASTAWYCIWYHKQLYKTMKQWSEIILAVYDGYCMQKAIKEEINKLSELKSEKEEINLEEQSHKDISQ